MAAHGVAVEKSGGELRDVRALQLGSPASRIAFFAPRSIRSRKRLATDWANLNREAPAFLRLASIRLMLRNLWNPARCFRLDTKRQMPTGTNRTFEKCWPTVNSSL